ncbi:HNH endonuclease signature motif containing protein [Microbacterium excoecariae]|uniref:HNH endonuclease signature motif containing protein n=1 Tax=Microbacterium excoecariae TaxID=2715210 RepID=UPI00140B696C|nr:HNH endonuclease signature motif containing protein [Microbacterium excoecariae]NHI17717.1 DUF222 domain-containing protein [Microbacterium excoecariae]
MERREAGGFATREEMRQAEEIARALVEIRAAEAGLAAQKATLLARADAIAAAQTARVGAAASREREMPRRLMAATLAAPLRANDRRVQSRMAEAARLVGGFPATLHALREGRIDDRHAHAIAEAGARIADPSTRGSYEVDALAVAEDSTPAATARYAAQAAERHAPRTEAAQRVAAVASRRVFVSDIDQATSMLGIIGPSAEIHGTYDRLTRQARVLQDDARRAAREGDGSGEGAGEQWADTRTADQTRADLALDMLLTGTPAVDHASDQAPGGLGAIRAHVQVTIPVTTLTGAAATPGELDGRCPVDPESARRLAGGASGWDRLLTDPVTGTVLATDRYAPTAAQQRFLRARDQHCRFPGCRQPARRCDIDHTIDHARGGPTAVTNLACLCKRHHTLKHATGWRVAQGPGGHLAWTPPAGGTTVIDRPPRRVSFVPAGEPG